MRGIRAGLIINEEEMSIVHFSSNYTSTLENFLHRLKPLLEHVVQILRQQQPHHIVLHVSLSLSFYNYYKELPYVVSLNHIDVDEVLDKLKFNTSKIDGGYFEMKIVDPTKYVDQQFQFLVAPMYNNDSSESDY